MVAHSAIVAAKSDTIVVESSSVGKGVLSPTQAQDSAQRSLGDELVVAGKGDLVALASPHYVSLVPGLYAERLSFTLLMKGLIVEQTGYRYFEVTPNGTMPSSQEAYSKAALRFTTLPDGSLAVEGSWAAAPLGEAAPTFAEAIPVEMPGGRKPSVVPDGSEKDEP